MVARWGYLDLLPLLPPVYILPARSANSKCGPHDQVKLSSWLQHPTWFYCATDNPLGMSSTNLPVGWMSHSLRKVAPRQPVPDNYLKTKVFYPTLYTLRCCGVPSPRPI